LTELVERAGVLWGTVAGSFFWPKEDAVPSNKKTNAMAEPFIFSPGSGKDHWIHVQLACHYKKQTELKRHLDNWHNLCKPQEQLAFVAVQKHP
jgi:hypothetical protein